MKYLFAQVIVGIDESESKDWSEGADVTRHLQSIGLHNPKLKIWLTGHDRAPYISESRFQNMHKCIDENGGI